MTPNLNFPDFLFLSLHFETATRRVCVGPDQTHRHEHAPTAPESSCQSFICTIRFDAEEQEDS